MYGEIKDNILELKSSRFFLGCCESVEVKYMLQLLSSTETYALPCVKLDSYLISVSCSVMSDFLPPHGL